MDTRSIIGNRQLVLDNSVAGLRDLGVTAQATNVFSSDIARRFDVTESNLVVLGGQVPSDRKVGLKEEIGGINVRVIFVESLARMPGPITNKVRGTFAADYQEPTPNRPIHIASSTALRSRGGPWRRLREALEDQIVELVEEARRDGWSWKAIAGALGVTAQAVHKRYAALLVLGDWDGHSGGRTTGPHVR